MFNDRNKPLYRLCEEIHLQRISESHYLHFLNTFFLEKWNKKVSMNVLNRLLELTQCHPYYVNAMLRQVFFEANYPTVEAIQELWRELIEKKGMTYSQKPKCYQLLIKKYWFPLRMGLTPLLRAKTFSFARTSQVQRFTEVSNSCLMRTLLKNQIAVILSLTHYWLMSYAN